MLDEAIKQAQAATLLREPAWKKAPRQAMTISLKKRAAKPRKHSQPKVKTPNPGAARVYWFERNAPYRLQAEDNNG